MLSPLGWVLFRTLQRLQCNCANKNALLTCENEKFTATKKTRAVYSPGLLQFVASACRLFDPGGVGGWGRPDTAKEAVHRYRLAQATKILRLNQQEQIELRAHLDLGMIMSGNRWSYNNSERNQIHGIITNLRDAVRIDGVRATNHWRESLSSYAGFGDPIRNNVTELFNLSGLWVRNRGNRAELKPKILQLVERLVSVLTDPGFHRLAP
jgi:hypothetical protein